MITQVFTVFDSKVGAYNRPFFEHSTGSALRAFIDALEDEQSSLSKHPEDYTLFHIGSYDDSNASFNQLNTPVPLGVALELKAQKHKVPSTGVADLS